MESFRVSRPSSQSAEFELHVGDESIVAPLAAFFPGVFGFDETDQRVRVAESYRSDCSDVFDEDYVAQTRWKQDVVRRQCHT